MSLKLMQLLFQMNNKIIRNFYEKISKIVSPLVVGLFYTNVSHLYV